MRKVRNKKAVRNLARKSFRANRLRNRITVIAIGLTAMLFSTLFTIGMGALESFQWGTMQQAGGDSHGTIKNITREQYEEMKAHPLIKECAPVVWVADAVTDPEFLKRHVEIFYAPAYHYAHRFLEIQEGKAPSRTDEILLDATSMELLGVPAKAGKKVTFDLKMGQEDSRQVEKEFTVSGVLEPSPLMNVGFAVVSEQYLETNKEELSSWADSTALTGRMDMEITFSNSFDITGKLERVITESGFSVTEGEEDYIAFNANWAYLFGTMENVDAGLIAAAAGGLLLVLFTGYLIIYNVFQISVIRDIQYYGLLKTIGTTGRQIRRIIRMQAWKLAVIGIPAGLAAGFFIGKWIVPFVVETSAYKGVDCTVSFHPGIFAGAVLFTLITVWISVRKPGKIAASVSPVEAVRYTDQGMKGARPRKSTDGGKLWKMAFSNLGRNKRRTAVVITALSLALILLNSIFTLIDSFDLDNKYLKKYAISDFHIASAEYYNFHYLGVEGSLEERALSESFVQACEKQEGFLEGGKIYMSSNMGLIPEKYTSTENVPIDENGDFYEMSGVQKQVYSKDADGNYITAFYGLEDLALEQLEIWKGEKDFSVIREKLETGKYILAGVREDEYGKVEEDRVQYRVGDKITLAMPDGQEREFEVLSLVTASFYGLTNRHDDDDHFRFFTTADFFRTVESDEYLMAYIFNTDEESWEAVEAFLEDYTKHTEPTMNYESRLRFKEESEGMVGLVIMIGGVLTGVIAFIGILNFVNSILTGIVTRRREFAMLEAIGMTRHQLVSMLMMEGLYYAALTIACSFAAGCLFSLTVVKIIAGNLWFMSYHFVIWPMLAVFPVLLLLGAVLPYLAYLSQKKKSIVDELRENQ